MPALVYLSRVLIHKLLLPFRYLTHGHLNEALGMWVLLWGGQITQRERKKDKMFIKASYDIDLEVNSEKSKYMNTSRNQNVVKTWNIVIIGNLSFENVEKFRYRGVTVTNTKVIHKERHVVIHFEKFYRHSYFSINWKFIHKTIISVVLYDSETWSLTLREVHRLRVFESKVLRNIFGAKRDEIAGEWRK